MNLNLGLPLDAKPKGRPRHVRHTFAQSIQLIEYLRKHLDGLRGSTCEEAASAAERELGFAVTKHNINGALRTMGPSVATDHGKRPARDDLAYLAAEVVKLWREVDALKGGIRPGALPERLARLAGRQG